MLLPNNPLYKYIRFKGDGPYRRYIRGENSALQTFSSINSSDHVHGSFGAALLHPKWKAKRMEIISRDSGRCVNCKSDKNLQVHHRQYHFIKNEQRYKSPWEYTDNLLVTLCESCNSRGHASYKIPTITV